MVGLQFAGLQKSLGPLLNGVVNFDFWVPNRPLIFPALRRSSPSTKKRLKARVSILSAITFRHTPMRTSKCSGSPWRPPRAWIRPNSRRTCTRQRSTQS